MHAEKPLIFIEEQFPYNRFLDMRRVIIRTPSRLHITLIDMHGGSGRVDGGSASPLTNPPCRWRRNSPPPFPYAGATRPCRSGCAALQWMLCRNSGQAGVLR
ncbi:MAG: hypothetical protein WCB46_06980 [Methanoregula sp.]